MKIIESKSQIGESINKYLFAERKVGLISTMGRIHEGHQSLIRKAREMSDVVVVLVFFNPLLVGDPSLLAMFEASKKHDNEMLEEESVDFAFYALRADFFRAGHRTFVRPSGLIQRLRELESEKYITFLATAYFQILNLFHPTFFFMGQRNYVDFLLLKRLIKDDHFTTEAVLCPTVRDENGIPYSSFYHFFTEEDRRASICLYQAVRQAREMLADGEYSAAKIVQQLTRSLQAEPRLESANVGVFDPLTMEAVAKVQQEALVLITARSGRFHITDNIIFRRNAG